jgi:hypothetical protein
MITIAWRRNLVACYSDVIGPAWDIFLNGGALCGAPSPHDLQRRGAAVAITAGMRRTAQRIRSTRKRGKHRGRSFRSSLAHLAVLCRRLRILLLQLLGLLFMLLEVWRQVRGFFKDQTIPP